MCVNESFSVVNKPWNHIRRVDMVFGIGYDDNIKQAKETLQGLLDEDERVLKDPSPLVAVGELADSSVNLNVRPWVKSEDYWTFKFDFTEKVKTTFDEKKISIPYPQMDVHLDKTA